MARAKKQGQPSISIESVKHKDKRANIPTEELRDFIADEEKNPKPVLYPRDTSLDPQLVWKGKDEQDQKNLEVSAVPIYIQEKIHPHAITEDFRAQAQQEKAEAQLSLFGDFNGIKFEQLVDFYQHKEGVKWTNRLILGDSLLVMSSLAEKEGLKGKVQMIYIDPPYGIKFGSNWQVSTRKRDVKDGKAEEATRQPEQIKAFRDTWEFGIHSYLAYLRERLVVARELLTETGSVFVQIGDENVHLVRCLMDEVFGNENFMCQIYYSTTGGFATNNLTRIGDYIIWYAKQKESAKYRQLFDEKASQEQEKDSKYDQVELSDGTRTSLGHYLTKHSEVGEPDQIFRYTNICGQGSPNSETPIVANGETYLPPKNNHWKASYPEGMNRLLKANRIAVTGKTLSYVRYLNDFKLNQINNVWDSISGSVQSRSEPKVYVVQTGIAVIQRCILMTTDPGDLVLDPTMGSATTAYAAEQWGRRWITIDTSRVALALARTRLMSAKYPYYLLADSSEGIQKEIEITGQLQTQTHTEGDIRKGFVYKRVPHVTLKAIANNPEIDTIHAKWQEQLEPIRINLNQLLKKAWQEWEIPREPQEKWSQEAKDSLAKCWELRQQRQKEIDNAISYYADTEILYDQPYEDKKRVRVTGPFTVESLSPHRVLSTGDERREQRDFVG